MKPDNDSGKGVPLENIVATAIAIFVGALLTYLLLRWIS